MSEAAFDEVIHAPNRLQICALLAAVESAEFSTIRDALNVSDSALSKHIKILQNAGYLTITKARKDAHRHTWLALTTQGQQALARHLAELRRIADLADRTDPAPGPAQ
jgi:DNA-binding MarR family transcriptional regulator